MGGEYGAEQAATIALGRIESIMDGDPFVSVDCGCGLFAIDR